MEINNVTGVVFSPAESTKRVVNLLGAPLSSIIDVTKREENPKDCEFSSRDLVIFGVPSYGGRVPALAAQRFERMKGNLTPAVLVVTYGNRAYDDTLLELKEIITALGFIAAAAVASVTEHSIMHQYGQGRPDQADESELTEYGQRIRIHLKGLEEERLRPIAVPGNVPYREYKGVPLKPKADKNCCSCGICEAECPAGAISKQDFNSVDEDVCISCMRCIKVCPSGARGLNPIMLAGASMMLKKACGEPKKNELILG